jgi:hypothetical protein
MHTNTYQTTTKIDASISPVCLQYGQHTEVMRHALVDCQSVGPFWINILGFISGQVDPMSDADAMLLLCLPTDMHIHRPIKPMVLVFAYGLWVVHCARIRHIHTNASSSVRSFTAE